MTAGADRPRVLLVCDWFLRYTVGLAGGLAQHGSSVALLTRSHGLEFGSAPGAMREYVRAALGPDVPHLRLGHRVRDPRALPELLQARDAARRLAPDVVHVQDSLVNDPRLFVAARAHPGRYALTVHDVETHPGDPRLSLRQRALRRALVRAAGLIFVHAESLRERLIAQQRPRAEVVVVPHGSDAPAVTPLPEHPSFLLFGRLSRYKGLDTLLEAMPLVWDQAPETRLTIAGNGKIPSHPALADERVLVRNEYVPDADVPALFGRATCVVLPYREASQSGVASLARSYGRGLVATRVGGLCELTHDDGVQLVPPEDPRALADAMVTVARTPELAARMSEAAAEAMRAELAWPRVAERTLAAYQRFLARDKPA